MNFHELAAAIFALIVAVAALNILNPTWTLLKCAIFATCS